MNPTAALAALPVAQLRRLASRAQLAGRSRLRRAELVAALLAHPRIETLLAITDLPQFRPEATAAEAGTTADPELREAEQAAASGESIPLTRRQAEHLVVIDQQQGDVPDAGFAREDWLAQAEATAEERWLDEPGANALSDAYRIVMGLQAPADPAN